MALPADGQGLNEADEICEYLGIRMTMLYAVAQSSNGMVANTCNYSEDYIGYATLDRYVREGVCEDPEIKEKIDRMHRRNLFKTEILHIPTFIPSL